MSETAATPDDTTNDETTAEVAATETTDTEPTDANPGREAARYRRQLRETEAERDTLHGKVEAMQKLEVERLVATDMATPADVWLTDVKLADLVDDNGDIDPAKVTQAVAGILTSRPGWRRTTVASFDGGVRTTPAPTTATFQEVLQGRKR